MESDIDMVIGFNNIDASLLEEKNVRLFLKDTFSSGVSIENVFDSLGGSFNGLVFFLQAFEVWLEKHKKESPVLGEESPAQDTMEICHTAPNNARDEICAEILEYSERYQYKLDLGAKFSKVGYINGILDIVKRKLSPVA